MDTQLIRWATLVVGILFTLFGLIVLFSPTFLTWLREGLWKEKKGETLFVGLLSKKSGLFVDKYVTGVQSILLGIVLLAFFYFT